jgi:HTH-type transcriptional regulator / antitoxin HipB
MIVRTPVELGAVIRDKRRKLGLEQSSLAAKVGVSRQWIINIEKGKPRAAVGLILRTLSALGIALRTYDEPPRQSKATDTGVDLDAVIARARKLRP